MSSLSTSFRAVGIRRTTAPLFLKEEKSPATEILRKSPCYPLAI